MLPDGEPAWDRCADRRTPPLISWKADGYSIGDRSHLDRQATDEAHFNQL